MFNRIKKEKNTIFFFKLYNIIVLINKFQYFFNQLTSESLFSMKQIISYEHWRELRVKKQKICMIRKRGTRKGKQVSLLSSQTDN